MQRLISIVGATGSIGKELAKILAERGFDKSRIKFLASKDSEGMQISYGEDQIVTVSSLTSHNFTSDEIVFMVAGSGVSQNVGREIASKGCIVIDGSSYFRMDPDVPLVIPEVNPHVISNLPDSGIIASPNCSTTEMLVALKPLHDLFGVRSVYVSTYQSVSGVGEEGMDELYESTKRRFAFTPEKPKVFPRNIEFNCIPQIGELDELGFSEEERKMLAETQKIFEDQCIDVFPTCVRVPVFVGHGAAITATFNEEVMLDDVYDVLSDYDGIVFLREGYKCQPEVVGYDDVFISRLRLNNSHTLSMWVATDNIRKGGALNLVQIFDLLLQNGVIT